MDFKAFNHGKNKIDLSSKNNLVFMRPTEIHLKEDGDINDEPSFAIIMAIPFQSEFVAPVVGEISLKMFNEALESIGYKIIKQINNNI